MESVIITYFQTIFKHEVHIIWSKYQALIFQPFTCSSTASYKMYKVTSLCYIKVLSLAKNFPQGCYPILHKDRISLLHMTMTLCWSVYKWNICVFHYSLSVHICWYIMTRLLPFLKKSNKGTSNFSLVSVFSGKMSNWLNLSLLFLCPARSFNTCKTNCLFVSSLCCL